MQGVSNAGKSTILNGIIGKKYYLLKKMNVQKKEY